MNLLKRTIAALLTLAVCTAFLLPFSAFAADEGYKIEVSELTAVPGDTVIIAVDLTENKGIMALTYSLCYDKEAFTFKQYKIGVFKHDYLVVDHPESGYISVVDCESKNRTYTGVILSAEFTVKENAAPGKHDFSVKHIYPLQYGEKLEGCFAVSNDNATAGSKSVYSAIPSVKQGSVTVGKTCTNAGHEFSDYEVTVKPTCDEEGVKTRTCTRCGHIENEPVAATGHSFEDFWTVDKAATDNEAGIMSRHCKNCSFVTDEISFLKEEAEKEHIENEVNKTVSEKENKFVHEKAEEIREKQKEEPQENGDPSSPLGDVFSGYQKVFNKNLGIVFIAAAAVISVAAAIIIIILARKSRK